MMRRRTGRFILGVVVLATITTVFCYSQEQKRLALVIGNAGYSFAPLRNPVNDANAMAAKLESLHFKVIKVINGTLRQMVTAENDFANDLNRYDVGLFYYSGHGVQYQGTNYLIPVNADIQRPVDIQFDALNVNRVLADMGSAGTGVNIIILDACRNNPFETQFRSMERGLSVVQAPTGSLVVYSTAPDQVASDGRGKDSPFTQALLNNIANPGQNVQLMLTNVFRQVQEKTRGRQVPWSSSSLTSAFYFAPTAPATVAAAPAAQPKASQSTVQSRAPTAPIQTGPKASKVGPSASSTASSGSAIASLPQGTSGQTQRGKGQLTIDVTAVPSTHDAVRLKLAEAGTNPPVVINRSGKVNNPFVFELDAGTYQIGMGFKDDLVFPTYTKEITVSSGVAEKLRVQLNYSQEYKANPKFAELQSDRRGWTVKLQKIQQQRASMGGWGGFFAVTGLLCGVGAGIFAIVANNTYASYQSATNSNDASAYRTQLGADRGGFLATAIAGGISLLIGVITLSARPSPNEAERSIQTLDAQLAALRASANAGQ